jgi:hypothetical protein
MDEDQPYPLQEFNVRLQDILAAMYRGPNPGDYDLQHRFDVHLQHMLDPDGDRNVWLRIPLPDDLQQPYLGGHITAQQVQQAAVRATAMAADRQLGQYVQFLALPPRVLEIWPSSMPDLQERVVSLTALLCAWALVINLLESIECSVFSSHERRAYRGMLTALVSPGAIAADHVLYRFAVDQDCTYAVALDRASRQRARALSMLITCRQAQQQLQQEQQQSAEQQLEQLHLLTIRQQQQQLYDLRAQFDACFRELVDSRAMYRDLLREQHRTLSNLLSRHDGVHVRYRRLQLRHQALRQRLRQQHEAWLAEHDQQQQAQQQQPDWMHEVPEVD